MQRGLKRKRLLLQPSHRLLLKVELEAELDGTWNVGLAIRVGDVAGAQLQRSELVAGWIELRTTRDVSVGHVEGFKAELPVYRVGELQALAYGSIADGRAWVADVSDVERQGLRDLRARVDLLPGRRGTCDPAGESRVRLRDRAVCEAGAGVEVAETAPVVSNARIT